MSEWEMIHGYSRAEALQDGNLVDVSAVAKQAGFKIPVAVTRAVWVDCCEWTELDDQSLGQSTQGRLWDVLCMAYLSAKSTRDGSNRIRFQVLRVPRVGSVAPKLVSLLGVCGPGDTAEPVVTIGFKDDF